MSVKNTISNWLDQGLFSINSSLSWSVIKEDRLGQVGLLILLLFAFVGLFAPLLAPYGVWAHNYDSDGDVLRTESPSNEHILGTTQFGRDVFSQLVMGTRTSLIVGGIAALITILIGTNIGLMSGYYGGWIDDIFMRITDFAYALPFLPFALAVLAILGPGLINITLVISLIMWRGTARVIRAQVLSEKEKPYVESARAVGSSDLRIMYIHILPNVFPIVFLYGAFAVGWSIIAEAEIAFLGFGDPDRVSWGKMIFQAYNADVIQVAWWWVIPPGICIVLVVMSVFFIGRAIEEVIDPELRDQR